MNEIEEYQRKYIIDINGTDIICPHCHMVVSYDFLKHSRYGELHSCFNCNKSLCEVLK